ncbi:MAG: helix-turn-helix transcriptional regulator [Alphaproteobacteria bacterium]|nr:MAG: helix-turn-helix transcriptional regulator [Alphaproteobacteria bacterium]
MALTPDQLRAARALLNISQDELANASGASLTSIRQFELGGITKLQQKTESALLSYLSEKIEFIGVRGVALREKDHLILEGENVIAQMFEDIHTHLRGQEGAEALFLCGSTPCLFAPELVEYCNALREADFTYRAICHKKDATSPIRTAPANFTPLPLQVVYGSTVAQMLGPDRILLVRTPMLAKGLKQTFEMLWEALPSPEAETEEGAGEPRKKALRA